MKNRNKKNNHKVSKILALAMVMTVALSSAAFAAEQEKTISLSASPELKLNFTNVKSQTDQAEYKLVTVNGVTKITFEGGDYGKQSVYPVLEYTKGKPNYSNKYEFGFEVKKYFYNEKGKDGKVKRVVSDTAPNQYEGIYTDYGFASGNYILLSEPGYYMVEAANTQGKSTLFFVQVNKADGSLPEDPKGFENPTPPDLNNVKIVLNGKWIPTKEPSFVEGERVLVPFRGVLTAMGAEIGWDEPSMTASASLNGKEVKIIIGSTTAYVNGEAKSLDVPGRTINGSTFLPVRFLAENLDLTVQWDEAAATVSITSK